MKQFYTLTLGVVAVLSSSALSIPARAQEFLKYPIVITPAQGDVNSAGNDYAPVISSDERSLLFTTFGRQSPTSTASILTSSASGTSAASDITVEGTTVEGAISIAGDGKTVVFAAHRADAIGDVDLYTGTINNGHVESISNMGPAVNTKGWESHPCIGADGNTVYFASDRKGGYGRTDIYVTTRNAAGQWSEARNLGPNVNTSKDERSPFITPDGGTLYFSSKGHEGYGGYDVFMAVKKADDWGDAVNLGPTINTNRDELFLFAPKSSGSFYFSSSRDGGKGGLDIYSGSPNIYGAGMFSLNLSLVDSTTQLPLPGVVSVIDMDNGNNVGSMTMLATQTSALQYLPAGRRFRLEARVRDVTQSVILEKTEPNAHVDRRLVFGNIVLKTVDFGKYDIPFFVSGYYRPNTLATLDELVAAQSNIQRQAPYIESVEKGSKRYQEYATYAQTVGALFSTLSTSCVEDIFPAFRDKGLPGEVLELRVTGYADPNPLTGNYIEPMPSVFEDTLGHRITIQKGDALDNTKLSGLRAVYSAMYLDSIMSAASEQYHNEYNKLKSDKRIVFRCVGASVIAGGDQMALKRRILVQVIRRQAAPGDELMHQVAMSN